MSEQITKDPIIIERDMPYLPDLALMPYRGSYVPVSKTRRIFPWFTRAIMNRVKQKKATIILFVGQAGVGKTHGSLAIARAVQSKFSLHFNRTLKKYEPHFNPKTQIVFTYSQFINAVRDLPEGKIIVFDEPSYVVGKRDWYKDLNKAIVQVIESFRFKVHPLFIPVINRSLLDKTIRNYLIQFQIEFIDRGKAKVLYVSASQRKDKIYWNNIGRLYIGLLDTNGCAYSRQKAGYPHNSKGEYFSDWCPTCKLFNIEKAENLGLRPCFLLRAVYERLRGEIQEQRYTGAKELIDSKELPKISLRGYALALADEYDDLLGPKGKVSQGKISIETGVSYSQAQRIKAFFNDFTTKEMKKWELPEPELRSIRQWKELRAKKKRARIRELEKEEKEKEGTKEDISLGKGIF